MRQKTDEERREWERQVRAGALQSFAFFRKRLQKGGELDRDTRDGLIDLLDYTEEHLVKMWALTQGV